MTTKQLVTSGDPSVLRGLASDRADQLFRKRKPGAGEILLALWPVLLQVVVNLRDPIIEFQ